MIFLSFRVDVETVHPYGIQFHGSRRAFIFFTGLVLDVEIDRIGKRTESVKTDRKW